ncbi:MAG: HD domain-containing protein [Candidatus Riflebacteria bacterium]|nr:HD domain-containing protein [Candidatus Riflebacteria bacterium]
MQNPAEELAGRHAAWLAKRDAELMALLENHLFSLHAAEPYNTHHVDHHLRVRDTCAQIGLEMDADLLVLESAALLHDIGRLSEGPGECHAAISADLAETLLAKLGVPDQCRKKICDAIRTHRYSSGIIPESLEGRILQDADRLDALGAIGVIRVVIHDATKALYDLREPFPNQRPLSRSLILDAFYEKILKLKDGFHTAAARKMAEKRHPFLVSFLEELRREIFPRNCE